MRIWNEPEPEYNEDGTEKHIVCEGARYHVPYWDSYGEHCTEPNCEINRRYRRSENIAEMHED